MLVKRELLKALLQATTDEDTRYFLSAVQVKPDGTVTATNGHMLLIGKETGVVTADAAFPDKGLPVPRATLSKPVLLSVSLIQKLLKVMPTKPKADAVLSSILVAENDKAEAFAAATDLETPFVAWLNSEEQAFPTVEKVLVDRDRRHVKLTLNADLLQRLAKAAQAVTGRKEAAITFEVQTQRKHWFEAKDTTVKSGHINDQVPFTISSSEFDVEGVIMPMRP